MGASALATSVLGLSAASAGMQIGSGVSQFIQSRDRAEQQEEAADLQADLQRRQRRRQRAATRASFGARGVQMTGSPLDVLTDAAAEAELEARLTEFGGELQAHRTRRQGTASLISGIGGGISTGIGGAASAQSIQPGIFSNTGMTIGRANPSGSTAIRGLGTSGMMR